MPLKAQTYSFGGSVRGPLHKKEGRANEDAWLRSSGSYGSLIVVCDGMGSRNEARFGARAACLAAREAVVRWSQAPEAPLSYLVHLVEVYWRLRIHPVEPNNAATTCLLALMCGDGSWVVGGVGDGLALVKTGEELVTVVGNREDNFSNVTEALGVSKGAKSWKISRLSPTDKDRMAVLATDGIADDLITEKMGNFCGWLVDTFKGSSPDQRWRLLSAELRSWPTPKHQDDKTLAVLHAPKTME